MSAPQPPCPEAAAGESQPPQPPPTPRPFEAGAAPELDLGAAFALLLFFPVEALQLLDTWLEALAGVESHPPPPPAPPGAVSCWVLAQGGFASHCWLEGWLPAGESQLMLVKGKGVAWCWREVYEAVEKDERKKGEVREVRLIVQV